MATFNDLARLTAAGAQLGNAAAAVFTSPAGKKSQVGTIILHNTNTSVETVQLFDNGSTAAYRFLSISLAPGETFEWSPKTPLCLAGSEAIQGLSTTASKVNITLEGRSEA